MSVRISGMSRHENLKIIAFVGLKGSGKSTILAYLTEKGYPKVTREEIVSQIHHLADAGQHRVITDELTEFDLYRTMKHEFPAELTVVAITTEKQTRHHRLSKEIGNPLNERQASESDWEEVEHKQAELIGLADHYLSNDGPIEELYSHIDELIRDLDFEI